MISKVAAVVASGVVVVVAVVVEVVDVVVVAIVASSVCGLTSTMSTVGRGLLMKPGNLLLPPDNVGVCVVVACSCSFSSSCCLGLGLNRLLGALNKEVLEGLSVEVVVRGGKVAGVGRFSLLLMFDSVWRNLCLNNLGLNFLTAAGGSATMSLVDCSTGMLASGESSTLASDRSLSIEEGSVSANSSSMLIGSWAKQALNPIRVITKAILCNNKRQFTFRDETICGQFLQFPTSF